MKMQKRKEKRVDARKEEEQEGKKKDPNDIVKEWD